MSVPKGTFYCDISLGFPFPSAGVHRDPSNVFCLSLYLLCGTWLPSVGKGLSLMSISLIACSVSTITLETPVLVQSNVNSWPKSAAKSRAVISINHPYSVLLRGDCQTWHNCITHANYRKSRGMSSDLLSDAMNSFNYVIQYLVCF